jgi:hypothetical protein
LRESCTDEVQALSVKTPEEKQRDLAAWHTEWERKWRHTIVLDETYAHDGQYAETIEDMSASAEAETDYWREANRILGS